jgi:hypothetical protein
MAKMTLADVHFSIHLNQFCVFLNSSSTDNISCFLGLFILLKYESKASFTHLEPGFSKSKFIEGIEVDFVVVDGSGDKEGEFVVEVIFFIFLFSSFKSKISFLVSSLILSIQLFKSVFNNL